MKVTLFVLIGTLSSVVTGQNKPGRPRKQYINPDQSSQQQQAYVQAAQLQNNQYVPQSTTTHHGGGGGGHGGSLAYSPGSAAKHTYPLLLSDSRSQNHDGSINFQYAADNGLQQGETVDPDGTRRGFYSYIGADGKPITVKYTAGKNGFVAEGDHLPKQPQSAPHSDADELGGRSNDGNGNYAGPAPVRPIYSSSQGQGSQSYPRPRPPPPAPVQYHQGGQPSHYTQSLQAGPRPIQQYRAAPAYSAAAGSQNYNNNGQVGFFGGGGGASPDEFADFGPDPYGGPQAYSQAAASPQTQYRTHVLPAAGTYQQPRQVGFPNGNYARPSSIGGQGVMHSAFSPYEPRGPAGPYAGNFDLGNGGQFSIDFNPGPSQEVTPGGDYGGHLQSQRQY